jgi:hypothetical protein
MTLPFPVVSTAARTHHVGTLTWSRPLPAHVQVLQVCTLDASGAAMLHASIPVQSSQLIHLEYPAGIVPELVFMDAYDDAYALDRVTLRDAEGREYTYLPLYPHTCAYQRAKPHTVDLHEYTANSMEYEKKKRDTLIYTLVMTMVGGCLLSLYDPEVAGSFAAGGGIGVVYEGMLQIEVDTVGRPTHLLSRLACSPAARLGLIASLAWVGIEQSHDLSSVQCLFGVSGFMMHKVALIVAFAI